MSAGKHTPTVFVVIAEGDFATGIRQECATRHQASALVESLSRFGLECRIVEKPGVTQ